jgi:hypothetical protein
VFFRGIKVKEGGHFVGQIPEGLRVEIMWENDYKNEDEVREFVERMRSETGSEVFFSKVMPNQL